MCGHVASQYTAATGAEAVWLFILLARLCVCGAEEKREVFQPLTPLHAISQDIQAPDWLSGLDDDMIRP